jgi:hypothetical protein
MKPLTYRPPCDERGEFLPWLNALRNQSGVYVIRQRAGLFSGPRCCYIGESHSSQLGKTIKRHFFAWRDDDVRKHHTYDRHRVEIAVRLTPPNTAVAAQNNLIARLLPRDNSNGTGGDPF